MKKNTKTKKVKSTLTPTIQTNTQQVPDKNAQQFYRALEWSNARTNLYPVVRSEAWNLRGYRALLAKATVLEVAQNFPLLNFLVNTHLNFISAFSFQASTPNQDVNIMLEKWFKKASRKENVDVQRHFSLQSMIRHFAGMKIWYGDSIAIKCKGGKLQLLESWNIARGAGCPPDVNTVGLIVDDYGAHQKYCISTGDTSGTLTFREMVDWQNAIYDGYFIRPSATRPASPLLPAMNLCRDYLDCINFEVLKNKIAAMYGIVIYRDHTKKGGYDFNYNQNNTGVTDINRQAGELTNDGPIVYEIEPGLKLELEQKDKMEVIESNNPSDNFQNFSVELTRLILSSLGMPYTLYNSKGSSWNSMRGDFNLYKQSTHEEREKNKECMRQAIEHMLDGAIANGELELPDGMDRDDIEFDLIPKANYIIDMSKEVDGYMKLLAGGLITSAHAMHELGQNRPFKEVTDARAKEIEYQQEKGVNVSISLPGAPLLNEGLPAVKPEDDDKVDVVEPGDEVEEENETPVEKKKEKVNDKKEKSPITGINTPTEEEIK